MNAQRTKIGESLPTRKFAIGIRPHQIFHKRPAKSNAGDINIILEDIYICVSSDRRFYPIFTNFDICFFSLMIYFNGFDLGKLSSEYMSIPNLSAQTRILSWVSVDKLSFQNPNRFFIVA